MYQTISMSTIYAIFLKILQKYRYSKNITVCIGFIILFKVPDKKKLKKSVNKSYFTRLFMNKKKSYNKKVVRT